MRDREKKNRETVVGGRIDREREREKEIEIEREKERKREREKEREMRGNKINRERGRNGRR